MNEDAFESLTGQVQALSMVLTDLITVMPPPAAAAAARNLHAAIDVEREQDELSPALTQRAIASRDAIVGSYLGLLDARSRA